MLTDPIADMLTRIRNAHLALHKEVNVPRSKMKESLAAILKQEGYVDDVTVDEGGIKITLNYQKGKAAITGLSRISKPRRRVFVRAGDIPRVQNGLGICILSTSSGVLDGEAAKEESDVVKAVSEEKTSNDDIDIPQVFGRRSNRFNIGL